MYGKVDGKSVSTNLDGTKHYHIKNQLMASAAATSKEYKTVSPATAERIEAIQKAHEENIQSQNALTEEVKGLREDVRGHAEELRGLKQEVASVKEVIEQLVSAYMRVNKNAF